MTRDQIKRGIADIIFNIEPVTMEEAYILWDDAMDAAGEIIDFLLTQLTDEERKIVGTL